MTERVRENYFLVMKLLVILVLEIYIVFVHNKLTGASGGMLLLLALYMAVVLVNEFVGKNKKIAFLIIAGTLLIALCYWYGSEFFLLGAILLLEIISILRLGAAFYFFPCIVVFFYTGLEMNSEMVISLFLGSIYLQHAFMVVYYQGQLMEDIRREQRLKEDIFEQQHDFKEKMNNGLLLAENQLLEERERLSQILHDKLGHNINGSIYQLEAVKVLMEQDVSSSKSMVQAVIDNLRNGMDEIRAILRKERPQKHKLALIQLKHLCEECSRMGVDAKLVIEGELSQISNTYLEIILDNSAEAVSNALKYAKCTKLEIMIHIMSGMVRCKISDNGNGCKILSDGMGIAGMRKRVRAVNGTLDFESEVGFTINMLLPINH